MSTPPSAESAQSASAAASPDSASPGSGEVAPLLSRVVADLGGRTRPGQVQMAQAIEHAIAKDEHLVVQAGTGTGKSLAYLVPAAAHAVQQGKPVVISTATLALQNQLVASDLPRLAKALREPLGRAVTWQLVKGRSNYVCVNKIQGGYPQEEETLFDADVWGSSPAATTGGATALGQEVSRLREWAESSESGDRDELVPGVSERAWRQVSVTARQCLGQKCPVVTECFSETARAQAHDVDLVISNHAFVSIDSFEGRHMLPEHDVLIFDEGHELVDRVTSVISQDLAPATVSRAATSLRRLKVDVASDVEIAAEALSDALDEQEPGLITGSLDEDLVAAVAALQDRCRAALTELTAQRGGDDVARHLAKAATSELHDVAERVMAAAALASSQRWDVLWVSASSGSQGPSRRALNIAPISVAGMLREKLFGERTVVITSATLALGGSFDSVQGELGLAGTEAPQSQTLDVGSPFEYPKQGMLYVAAHLPAPGRDGPPEELLNELEQLIKAAGGRALGLFSSRRMAELATEEMRKRLDVPILCQGEDQTSTLIRAFAKDEETCLFGTLSLWQGVDVPGPSCQLVVIDRIPFPRPDDPLSTARSQAVARSGGNGFMAVAAKQAALRLAQGAGRLVRSDADRGVVAILDSRMAHARYAGFLRNSMPPLWPTSDKDQVLAALGRINTSQ